MHREIKPVDLGLGIDAQGRDEGAKFQEHHRYHQCEDPDHGEAAKLGRPRACAEHGNHDGAEDAANAMHGEDIQRIVDLEAIAHEVDRFLAEDARDRADQERLYGADKARGRGDRARPAMVPVTMPTREALPYLIFPIAPS